MSKGFNVSVSDVTADNKGPACTGIENIDEAITLLEQNNWDLVAAINGVIPQENGILQSEYSGETLQGTVYGPGSHPSSTSSTPSASSAFRHVVPSRQIVERQPRMLDFRVEYRDRNVDVVLEDSSTVGGVKRVWRQPDEEYKDKCVLPTVKHGGGSVMVWGSMSAAGTGELQFIEGTMNANMYCDILKQSMIPSLQRLGLRVVFQHDNDPKHTSKTTTALLKKLRVKVMDWTSMSPDLNPIEPLWGILKQKVEERKVSNIHQLRDIKHILENELQIPTSKMLLKGWKTGDVDDSTVLKTLHLPKNNSLYVLTPDLPPPSSSNLPGAQGSLHHSPPPSYPHNNPVSALQESLNQNFMLIVTHREVQREYNLNFSGSSTIQEVSSVSQLKNKCSSL
ncbi:FAS-associated factor 1 [Varanus komodoensis]|nr:FAS-associated factor 1 [Varanus komodoensis]